MWYDLDIEKLGRQLLPPVLRSGVLTALVRVLLMPIRLVYDEFMALKASTDTVLSTTGTVIKLEKILNDTFFLRNREIYIETPNEEERLSMYFERANQKATVMHLKKEGTGVVLKVRGESTVKVNFTVWVPTFLCTSEDAKADRYGGRNLRVIRNILNRYKPAGRTFGIELYDYE